MDTTMDHRRCGTELYALLYQNLPEHRGLLGRENVVDAAGISRDLGITPQALYAWLQVGRFPPNRMMSLVNLPGSTLTVDKLLPFGAFKL